MDNIDDPRREKTLYITDLDEDVNEELLYELFLQAGPLESVSFKSTALNNPNAKPFAFVQYKHEESVPYAIALFNGIQLFGKAINIRPRDRTKMADKLRHAETEARQLRLNEQTPHIAYLQHQIRWPPANPAEAFPQAATYTRCAIARMFNPMLGRQHYQPISPPPRQFYQQPPPSVVSYGNHQFAVPGGAPPAGYSPMGDFSGQQRHYGGGYQQQQQQQQPQQRSSTHYTNRGNGDDRHSPYYRPATDDRSSYRNGRNDDRGGRHETRDSRGDDRGRHIHRSQSDHAVSDERRRNGGSTSNRHNQRR